MKIRRAKLEESNILSEIALKSKAYWGYDSKFIEECRADLTISEECISTNYVYVLEDKEFIIGFYCLIVNSNSGQLNDLFIDPIFIGKGYGRALWNSLIDKGKEIGMDEFTIDADPHAEEFYKKMGAVGIGLIKSTVFVNRNLPLMKMYIL